MEVRQDQNEIEEELIYRDIKRNNYIYDVHDQQIWKRNVLNIV